MRGKKVKQLKKLIHTVVGNITPGQKRNIFKLYRQLPHNERADFNIITTKKKGE